ncbi:MAG: hypothetical protein RIR74_1027, partial [Pseudomonadota bacterium]
MIQFSALDRVFSAFDNALKTLTTDPSGTGRPMPGQALSEASLNDAQRSHAAGLMRVNHAGEVAAQGLYQGQALSTASPQQAQLWYAGAFCLGLVAGRLPEAQGMGFVSETERQVEAHLKGHLSALPPEDA